MGKFDDKNMAAVAEQVDLMLAEANEYKERYGGSKSWYIRQVCERLSIFDWWNEKLSVSQLKKMKSFLRIAGEFGYNGYVCFKVGAAGCAHGMWASRNESETGYSPDGGCLFHSFRSGDNYYDVCFNDGLWAHEKYPELYDEKHGEFTYDDIKALLAKEGELVSA